MRIEAFRGKRREAERPAAFFKGERGGRGGVCPLFPKGRNKRRGRLTAFPKRIEMDEENAWTAFPKRKKRVERALGLLHQKGTEGKEGCA